MSIPLWLLLLLVYFQKWVCFLRQLYEHCTVMGTQPTLAAYPGVRLAALIWYANGHRGEWGRYQILDQPHHATIKKKLHKKSFIDDLTLLEKISLSNLIRKETIIGPLDWHDRFQLSLPADKSILQHQLIDLKEFTKLHHMKLNHSQTKCLPFINSNTKDFMPQLSLEEGTNLEVIYKLKLVGLLVTSDLTWTAHVDYSVARGNRVVWQLTRFRRHKRNLLHSIF